MVAEQVHNVQMVPLSSPVEGSPAIYIVLGVNIDTPGDTYSILLQSLATLLFIILGYQLLDTINVTKTSSFSQLFLQLRVGHFVVFSLQNLMTNTMK